MSLNQSGMAFTEIDTHLQFSKAVVRQEFWALMKRGGAKITKKQKKQPNS